MLFDPYHFNGVVDLGQSFAEAQPERIPVDVSFPEAHPECIGVHSFAERHAERVRVDVALLGPVDGVVVREESGVLHRLNVVVIALEKLPRNLGLFRRIKFVSTCVFVGRLKIFSDYFE